MTGLVSYTCELNSGTNVMRVINYFLIAFKNPLHKVKPISGTVNEQQQQKKPRVKKPVLA